MSKPILTFGGFAPLFIQQYERYLPTAFDESMSILQKMNKIIMYLNQMGTTVDNVVAQWNEVMEWILADGITDSVRAKLDLMVSDGTFASIINEELFADLNSKINKVNGLTLESVNLYVDGSLGVDSVGRGELSTPFKTIQYAVDSIPKIINHDRFIYVADGDYNEDIKVKSITGAGVVIGRLNGIVSASTGSTGLRVRSIVFYDCNGICRVNNFEQLNSQDINGVAFIRFSRCNYGTAHALRCADTSITVPSVEFDGTQGSLNSSYFNGQQNCLISKNGSSVRVDSTNEHGSTPSATGILAQAGVVYLNGTNEWVDGASNAIAQSQGGIVSYPIKNVELTLENGWVAYDELDNKPRAIKQNGVVYLQGIIKEGLVGQGVTAFTLPTLFTPQFNDRVFHPFGSDGMTTKCLLTKGGVFVVEVSTGQYISLSDIPPFYVGE